MIKNLEPVIKKERFLAIEQKKGKGGIFGWLGSSNKQHIPTATKDILHFMILVGMFVFEFQVEKDDAQIHAQELIFYNGYQVDSEGKSVDVGLIEATVEAWIFQMPIACTFQNIFIRPEEFLEWTTRQIKKIGGKEKDGLLNQELYRVYPSSLRY
mmetsp:Transcript_16427/g.23016  ORF Transcript_16427/g.23016 Transcript_16427/m.23016 type:complete len:155 (+) Transcript_16427:879-1343(+)